MEIAINFRESKTPNTQIFKECWALYLEAFPEDERRPIDYQEQIMESDSYHFEAIFDGEKHIGFIAWWEFAQLRYIEHLAIMEHARNGGYGSRILSKFEQRSSKMIILEVEQPTEEIQQRRIKFYERAGYVLNSHPYSQPPYRQGGTPLPLLIMSHPRAITCAELDYFTSECFKVIHPRNYKGD